MLRDIEHFKALNDHYGRHAGDVEARLRKALLLQRFVLAHMAHA